MKTTEDFKTKASLVHSNKYDYSKSVYTKSRNKVLITCPVHGDFEQVANAHLAGKGCRNCNHQSFNHTTESFIEKSIAIHNCKYDYTKTVYVKSHQQVTITCPIHGDFKQLPTNHIKGAGCGECGGGGFKTNKSAFLYIHTVKVDGEIIGYKIGITNKTVASRLKILQRKSSATIENVLSFEGSGVTILNLETLIHRECRLVPDLREVLPDGHSEVIHKDDLDLALTLIKEALQ